MKKRAGILTRVAVCASVAIAAGCASVDYVADAKVHVSAADWSKMKTVDVVLKEYSFIPEVLKFDAGTPYKLKIINTGTGKHYFTATGFFKAIATRKVQSNTDGEIKAPYFLALEVFPGRSLDLYFVPVRRGTYGLRCTIPGHEAQGMHGTIVIQ